MRIHSFPQVPGTGRVAPGHDGKGQRCASDGSLGEGCQVRGVRSAASFVFNSGDIGSLTATRT